MMKPSVLILVLAACGSPGATPATSPGTATARPNLRARLAPCNLDGVDRGTADGLDTSCVATMVRPPFVTDAAGFAALLQAAGD